MLKLVTMCSIHVIGDWGRRGQFFQKPIASRMEEIEYDAVISVGDNFYPEGIASPEDPHVFESWVDIYNPSTPWFVALGNHDHKGSAEAQTKIDLPHWNMPNNVYTFDLCNHSFVVMDSTHVDMAQWDKVDKLLTEAGPNKWIVAHHPIYSGGWHHFVDEEYRTKMVELYKKHGVIGILSGHDHDLQYIQLDGIHQVVSGAAASTYGYSEYQEGVQFFSEDVGFVHLAISSEKVNIEYIGLENILWNTTISI